jgi:hypothetical protein
VAAIAAGIVSPRAEEVRRRTMSAPGTRTIRTTSAPCSPTTLFTTPSLSPSHGEGATRSSSDGWSAAMSLDRRPSSGDHSSRRPRRQSSSEPPRTETRRASTAISGCSGWTTKGTASSSPNGGWSIPKRPEASCRLAGPGLQGQPLQACVNSTHWSVAQIEQVNFGTHRHFLQAMDKCPRQELNLCTRFRKRRTLRSTMRVCGARY